ncbi:hypothetical protein HG537_0H03010 [Torulaspora globosa]|uniref:Uncharacterized protein n=1 Tax=Torulaspora globosa TaxID=48254 RepID=A0A7H9HZG5_9SACH|nr:hypothetical protein HG537_0H03010 [Torulaspora sp. CBS 2947]
MNFNTSQESTWSYNENLILEDIYGHNDQIRNAMEFSNNASLSSSEDNSMDRIQVEKYTLTDKVRPASEKHIIVTFESVEADVDLQIALKDSYTKKQKKSNKRIKSITSSAASSTRKCNDDIIAKRAVNSAALEKPILTDNSEKFVSFNDAYDIEKSEPLTKICRINNLCDLPQRNCSKDDALITLKHVARGVANASEAHEYCAERKELKLKDPDNHIEMLENKVWKLTQELNELKRVTGKVDNETQETQNSCIKCGKELEMKRMNDKMEKLELDLEEKITRETILTEENNNLQMEVTKLKDSLLEQQNANDSLLCQVKNLDERLKTEMTNSIDIRGQIVVPERNRKGKLGVAIPPQSGGTD